MLIFLACLGLAGGLGSLHFLRDAARAAPALILLTPHGDNIRQELGAAFRSWYGERYGEPPELIWIDQGGTSEDLRYVQSRFAKARPARPRQDEVRQGAPHAGGSPGDSAPPSIGIDLFFGGGTPPFRTLARDGLLQPHALPPALLAGIPAEVGGTQVYSDSEGWYGVALSGFGILYNRSLLADKGLPVPGSWSDLGEPAADGWVASVDPRGSGSAHIIYEIILQKYGWERGWELLMRIGANSSHFTKGASAVLPLVSAGEAAYTIAIDQYAWSLIENLGKDRVGFVLPAGETVTTPDPVAILAGAPHPETARRFLEFLVSKRCQRLWSLKAGVPGGPVRLSLNRMSVLPAVAAELDSANSHVSGNPFRESETMDWSYSDSLTESRWALVNDALGLWMVDFHDKARRHWQAMNARSAGKDSSVRQAALRADPFFVPPAPWDRMRESADRWTDESLRNRTMAGWARRLND